MGVGVLFLRNPGAGFFNRIMKIVEYIKETKSEMKHVSWPTRRQAMAFTAIVIAISVFVAILLGLFDYLFTLGIEKFIA